jgi:hypothetical protein
VTWDDDFNEPFADETPPGRYWTARRILFTVLILLTLIAFLLYIYGTLLFPPHPVVPPLPIGTYTAI